MSNQILGGMKKSFTIPCFSARPRRQDWSFWYLSVGTPGCLLVLGWTLMLVAINCHEHYWFWQIYVERNGILWKISVKYSDVQPIFERDINIFRAPVWLGSVDGSGPKLQGSLSLIGSSLLLLGPATALFSKALEDGSVLIIDYCVLKFWEPRSLGKNFDFARKWLVWQLGIKKISLDMWSVKCWNRHLEHVSVTALTLTADNRAAVAWPQHHPHSCVLLLLLFLMFVTCHTRTNQPNQNQDPPTNQPPRQCPLFEWCGFPFFCYRPLTEEYKMRVPVT